MKQGLSSLGQRVVRHAQNLRRLWSPRPTWDADAEFAYYTVVPEELAAQWQRQQTFFQEGHFLGLRVAKAVGVLDTQLVTGARVLELGAGECVLSHALAQLGAKEVWACDAVPKQLWAAAAYGSQGQYWTGRAGGAAQGPCRYVVAEATSLPFVSGCFDLVVANLVLHHVRPVSAVLKEVRRLLRPGGVFAAAEPAPLAGMLAHDATSENEAPLWPQVITDALTQAGFVDVRSEYYWSRLETSRLGVLSPSYRVRGQVPAAVVADALPEALGEGLPDDAAILSRLLQSTQIPGLLLDLGAQAVSPGQPLSKQVRLAQLQIGQLEQIDLLAQLVASRVLRS